MKALHELRSEPSRSPPGGSLDVLKIRQDFPILRQRVHGKPLVYLDNAATAQKPQTVIDAIHKYYRSEERRVGKECRL